jgi:hypothetical protein
MAFLHNRVAAATIERTTLLCHENALQAFLYSGTNHRNHPLSICCQLMILPIETKKLLIIINAFSACQQHFGYLEICDASSFSLSWTGTID